jgi:hypothetical protein
VEASRRGVEGAFLGDHDEGLELGRVEGGHALSVAYLR